LTWLEGRAALAVARRKVSMLSFRRSAIAERDKEKGRSTEVVFN
jgi:hypothetical protein